jgi:CheY-like chemotaxis protein
MHPDPEEPHEVLVVDDDPEIRYLARRRLTRLGFQVIEAGDGLQALEAMTRHPNCSRMVTDYHMPGLGQDEWIRTLEARCPHWKIVVLSAADVDPGAFLSFPKPPDYNNIASYFRRKS